MLAGMVSGELGLSRPARIGGGPALGRATLAAALAATTLGGCAIVSDLGVTGLAKNIEDNAATLNEAHTRAMIATIAVNVLRARDRWPTNYTTLSGIKSNPTLQLNGGANFGPLGLGNPGLPFANSAASISRNEAANAEYSINPFANGGNTQSLLKPVDPRILERYWRSGWPREALIWMFVDAIKFKDSDAFSFVNGDGISNKNASGSNKNAANGAMLARYLELIVAADNGAADFGVLTPATTEERACAPYDPGYARQKLAATSDGMSDVISAIEKLTGKTLVLARDAHAGTAPTPVDASPDADPRRLLLCDAAPTRWGFYDHRTGVEIAEVRTRSFDDMIYFLGETLRTDEAGEEGAIGGVTLFRTYRNRSDVNFAVHVKYAGDVYFIAPQSPTKVMGSGNDQTGNVLGLLNQLYQFAQSDEFLRAPDARLR